MYKLILTLAIILSFGCSSDSANKKKPSGELKIFYPAGEKEKTQNEKGEEVQITNEDPEFFQQKSTNPVEMFRVIISSDSYQLRQIRGLEHFKRKPDPGGDALIMEELLKYNKRDFVDDGIIEVKLNSKTGKLETINTYRSTRIMQLLKIIQNDATRWSLEHKNDETPAVLRYLISYNVVITNKSSRDQIKEELKKEVK